jgi:hypothetical protein
MATIFYLEFYYAFDSLLNFINLIMKDKVLI